jgi:hypothetical protein
MSDLAQAPAVVPAVLKPSSVDRLRTAAAEASQVRALSTHPDVVALRVESIRTQVDVLMWAGIVLGLAFTMVNVQAFAADGAPVGSLPWVAAWLLDPMVSLVLIAVLRAEQITARYQVSQIGKWVTATKWYAFAATFTMNTWHSWVALDAAGIVLHSVPPLLILCAAETAPVLRDRLTEAVLRAEQAAALAAPEAGASLPLDPAPAETEEPAVADDPETAPEVTDEAPASEPAPKAPRKPSRPRRKPAKSSGRKLLGDYVAEALAAVEPGTAADRITPAWARHTTGCSTGLSPKVAAAVRAELTTHETTTHDAAAPGEPARIAA